MRGARIARTSLAAAVSTLVIAFATNAAAQWPPPQQQPLPSQPSPGALPGQPPAQQPNPYGSMQAGGLAPPPPMTAATTGGPTEQQLEKAKKEDSGRGLEWFWLNVEGGFEQLGLQTFNTDERNFTAGFVDTSASGGVIGAGLGLRLLFLTLGARGRIGFFKSFQVFSLGPEVGFHIPLGKLEPRIDLGGGWVGLGNIQGALGGDAGAASIRGFYARIGGGLDYYITPVFSLGLGVSWEVLGLTRPGLGADEIKRIKEISTLSDAERARADALAAEGSSFGSALAITGLAGLHF